MRVDVNQPEFDYLLINMLFTQQTPVLMYGLLWETLWQLYGSVMIHSI